MSDQTPKTEVLEQEEELLVREISKHEYEEHKQEVSERLGFQVDFAQALLKALLLVNGAAIISLLTFIGNVRNELEYDLMWWSFASFALGVAAALLSYFGAFYSQMHFMQAAAMQMWAKHGRSHGIEEVVDDQDFQGSLRSGTMAMKVGICGAAISLIGFVAGAFFALDSIL